MYVAYILGLSWHAQTQAMFISFEENLIKMWKFFKNSLKLLKIFIRIALKCKEFDTMSNKRQKKVVKKVKKACRTRCLCPNLGIDVVFDKYEDIVKI